MKNTLLVLLGLFLMSTTVVTVNKMSDRSKEQKVILGRNLNQLKVEIQDNFKLGYRVVAMVNQNQDTYSNSSPNDEIMVVMEK
ncbi:MAG: hypothetical protein ACK5OW_00225 [bacterium]|jgi:hypothetical protein